MEERSIIPAKIPYSNLLTIKPILTLVYHAIDSFDCIMNLLTYHKKYFMRFGFYFLHKIPKTFHLTKVFFDYLHLIIYIFYFEQKFYLVSFRNLG